MRLRRLLSFVATLLVCAVGVLAGSQWYAKHRAEEAAKEAERLAAEAMLACDTAASHPSDPARYAAPVPDDKIALIPAARACEEAVAKNVGSARAHFQLGRIYWLSSKDRAAVERFLDAQRLGYAAASKYLGDAEYEERGLPDGYKPDDQRILAFYQAAKNGGFTGLAESIAAAEARIRRGVFDPSLFQYAEYMEALYTGRFDDFKAPVALSYYVQGVIRRLDSNEHATIFVDLKCKPLINMLGNKIIDHADFLAAASELEKARTRSTEENFKRFFRAIFDSEMNTVYRDYGDRDANVLFDKDIYGCDSPVVKKIVGNVMFQLEKWKK